MATLRSPFFEIKVEGVDITPWVSAVTVVEDERQADSCSITIPDPRMIYADALFEGTEVEIDMGYAGPNEHALLLRAILTKVEMTYPDSGVPALVLKGEDRSIVMGFEERNHVWRNTTITGVVREIGLRNGFDPAHVNAQLTPDPRVVRPLHQDGKSDLAFLQELAEEHHARCFVELDELGAEVLHFIPERRAVTLRRPDRLVLRYRSGPESNLISFSPAFDATYIDRRKQLADLDERGNPVRSEKLPEPPPTDVVWALDPTALARASAVDNALIQALYTAGSRKKLELQAELAAARLVVGEVAADQAEISDKDDSLESRRLGQTASGATFGNIWLRAKTSVTLEGVASRFAGEWYVASVTHRIDGGGYRTDFKAVR